MPSISLRTIREEHASLAAVLHSLRLMLDQGPGDAPAAFFDVMRAMLFYERAPQAADAIAQLERDHEGGEAAVRELQHLLLGWELMGDGRREAFADALQRYVSFYLEHMRTEETVVLPAAQECLQPGDWVAIDAAFASNTNPLAPGKPRDAAYDRLFTRIVMRAPSPIGLG